MTESPKSDPAAAWKANTYLEKLPDDIQPFRELLETYSKVPAEEVDDRLYKIVWIYPISPCNKVIID